MNYFDYLLYSELAAFVASCISLWLFRGRKQRSLFFIMLCVAVTELGAEAMKHDKWFGKWLTGNHGAYNAFWLNIWVSVHIYLWIKFINHAIFSHKTEKRINKIALAYVFISTVFAFVILAGYQPFSYGRFFIPGYAVGVLLLSLVCIRYIYQFSNSSKIISNWFHYNLPIACALLLFYLGTLPFFVMRNVLYYKFPGIFEIYYSIFIIFDVLLYVIICISAFTNRGNEKPDVEAVKFKSMV